MSTSTAATQTTTGDFMPFSHGGNQAPMGLRKGRKMQAGTHQSAPVTVPGNQPLGNLSHNLQNDQRWDELVNLTTELGQQAGRGKDTQIKFLMAVVDAAYSGVIDLTKDKHGADVGDAHRLTEVYAKGQSGAVIFDHRGDSEKKMISMTKTCIKLGCCQKFGSGEPVGVVNRLLTTRQNLRKNPAYKNRLQDAANTLISFARAQLELAKKSGALIEDNQLETFCLRKEREGRSVEDVIDSCRKTLQGVYNGTHRAGVRNTPTLKASIDSLNKDLKAIAEEKKKAEKAAA